MSRRSACGLQPSAPLLHNLSPRPARVSGPMLPRFDPAAIPLSHPLTAVRCVNSAVQIDLAGQVNAERIAGSQYAGVGGQLDFYRGCKLASDALSILAIESTAAGGRVSRIVPWIPEGNAVTSSRYDVDVVVSEFGLAWLRDRSTRERARGLIEIAHADYRAGLEGAAGRFGLLRRGWRLVPTGRFRHNRTASPSAAGRTRVPVIVVTSAEEGAGKTGVAAAIARHLAYEGKPVRLLRLAGSGNSELDASYFASLPFVPGSPSNAVTADTIASPRAGTFVVEASLSDVPQVPADGVVLVVRGTPPRVLPAGLPVRVVVVTAAHPAANVPSSLGDVPVVALAEDRGLAGFSVSEARALLDAEQLVEGDDGDPTCDSLVIAPIGSDAGQPYLRRFPNKAVVCRFDRTDMHLAALRSDPQCLILTGGRRPSDYLFDAARSQGVPVLLSRTDTENTVIALEGVFDRTRFHGPSKLDRMVELLEPTAVFSALG